MRILRNSDLSVSQEFALQYLVRGYMVSRVIYMVEAFRGESIRDMAEENLGAIALSHIEPLGRA